MKKILVAEDDKFLGDAYLAKLTKAGYEVKIALDGEEALKSLETFMPDLILLDLVMPVRDGFSTLKELKSNDKYKSIPVIVSSNLGQAEDIEKTKSMGAVDFLVKSDISLNDLIIKIKDTIK